MLFHVGGEGSRPTFFELVAAEQLTKSIQSAIVYAIGILSQRHPYLHRVLDRKDDVLAGLLLLLELHSLRTHDASFGESLYGLRRSPFASSSAPPPSSPASSLSTSSSPARTLVQGPLQQQLSAKSAAPLDELSTRQRMLSLFFLVGLPYLRRKLQSLHARQRQQRRWRLPPRGDVSLGDEGRTMRQIGEEEEDEEEEGGGGEEDGGDLGRLWDANDNEDEDENYDNHHHGRDLHPEVAGSSRQSWFASLGTKLQQGLAGSYPLLHASLEGVKLVYQLRYLLQGASFYSPEHHIASIIVRRNTGQEMMNASRLVRERRQREEARLRGPVLINLIQKGFLRAAYFTLDNAQMALIASVFAFKMAEWWYTSGEQKVNTPTVYPPPPPPPPPKVAKNGVPLPSDRRSCPLCLKLRTNPAMPAVSGFVFCYPCIFAYVQEHRRCPVTHIPCTVDQVRRLFHNA